MYSTIARYVHLVHHKVIKKNDFLIGKMSNEIKAYNLCIYV